MRRHRPCFVRARGLVALQIKPLSEAELEISDTVPCGKKTPKPIAEHLTVKVLTQHHYLTAFIEKVW